MVVVTMEEVVVASATKVNKNHLIREELVIGSFPFTSLIFYILFMCFLLPVTADDDGANDDK